jgi:hypothetical protein
VELVDGDESAAERALQRLLPNEVVDDGSEVDHRLEAVSARDAADHHDARRLPTAGWSVVEHDPVEVVQHTHAVLPAFAALEPS